MMKAPDFDFLRYTLEQPDQISPSTFLFPSGRAHLEQVGVLRLEPRHPKPVNLVLSVGIHGNETAPIELVNRLVKDILSGAITLGVRLLVIIGHPHAIIRGERFVDVNLNRLFDGAYDRYEGMEVDRAQVLTEQLTAFYDAEPSFENFHYDLHTAIRGSRFERFAVHPYVGEAQYQVRQFGFLAAAGIEAVLLSHQPSTTFSYHSYKHHNAHAFTLELGKVRPFGENNLKRLQKMDTCLRTLVTAGGLLQARQEQLHIFSVVKVLVKDADDYQLHIASDEKNFTGFKQGFVLASSSAGEYAIEQDGDAIVFPNTNLPIGQRAGMVVRKANWQQLNKTW